MNDRLLKVYHYLPGPARSVAANLKGLYLSSWRYGVESERLIAEALERETWSVDRWKSWQEERLAWVLQRAATQVPYYREYWAASRRRGHVASWKYLENWPILKKESLRNNPYAFVADDCNVRWMFPEHTSGTTGAPLRLWWSKQTIRAWYSLFEARVRRWNGVKRHDNWAIIGGQPVIPSRQTSPPFWIWNAAMNQLYLSANHISTRSAMGYIDAIKRYQVTHLVAYPAAAASLAREAVKLGSSPAGIRVVLANAEPLLPWQRETLCKAFGSEVRETYGMAEIVAAASECEVGGLHLWPEVGWVEIFSDLHDAPSRFGTAGRLVCTSLLNADMPLIRYEVGDRGKIGALTCGCRRTLPVLAGIEGRLNDFLIAPDGRQVHWLNPVFYGLAVEEAQIIQENFAEVRVMFVPAPHFSRRDGRAIVDRLQARLGPLAVILEEVDRVPRESNGKFRAVVCKLPSEERQRAASG